MAEKDTAFREYRKFVFLVRMPLFLGLCLLIVSAVFFAIFREVAIITTTLGFVLLVFGLAGYVRRRQSHKQ